MVIPGREKRAGESLRNGGERCTLRSGLRPNLTKTETCEGDGQVTLRIERLLFQEEGEQIQRWLDGPSKVQGGGLRAAEPDSGMDSHMGQMLQHVTVLSALWALF